MAPSMPALGKPSDLRRTMMAFSLAVSLLMLLGKVSAYFLTHSAAVFSDAAESLVHGVATALAAYSLWTADRPADGNYHYGYGKLVYFSAGFEGALICVAALTILVASTRAFFAPEPLTRLGWGVAITGGLAFVNLGLGVGLVRVGRAKNALVLIANGEHVLSDMWTSVGALIGLLLVWLSGLRWIDSLTAFVLGIYILRTGTSLLRRAYRGLMDRADPVMTAHLKGVLNEAVRLHGLAGYHELRYRVSNDQVWVEFHVLVAGDISVETAHRLATQVEERVRRSLPNVTVWVTSHLEPADHTRAHPNGHHYSAP